MRLATTPIRSRTIPGTRLYSKVPDSAILEAGLKRFADSTEDVAWLEDKKDQSARSLEGNQKGSVNNS